MTKNHLDPQFMELGEPKFSIITFGVRNNGTSIQDGSDMTLTHPQGNSGQHKSLHSWKDSLKLQTLPLRLTYVQEGPLGNLTKGLIRQLQQQHQDLGRGGSTPPLRPEVGPKSAKRRPKVGSKSTCSGGG